MLDTLLKIGEWQSHGKGEWDRFLDRPKVDSTDKRGKTITNYVLPIIFDLDDMGVVIDAKNLREYDEGLVEPLKALKIQGGNNKAIYVTVPSNKFIQLYKTFFGKENENTTEGELSEAIRKEDPSLLTDTFNTLLSKIFLLKEKFLQQTTLLNENNGMSEVNFKAIETKLGLNKNEAIPLVYAAIKTSELTTSQVQQCSEIPEYLDFLRNKFFAIEDKQEKDNERGHNKKLCYASGQYYEDVEELNLSNRYSLNKMFVTETRNYATLFDKESFIKNYQVSRENQVRLDHASNFLLNEGGYKVRIANLDHVIIPQFLENDNPDLDLTLRGIKTKSDILFNMETLESAVKNLQDETDSIFWINFIAYESDGNFFKSTGVIKDVSNLHFQNVIKAFRDMHWQLKESNFTDWDSIMTEYGKSGRFFNFNTIYALIPLRKDKEKKNKALDLFKAILENRPVDQSKLFSYFCELILCHYYERYDSYTNIPKSSKDYFPKTVRDCVFKYLAFIKVLKQLQLIDMEESAIVADEATKNYNQAVNEFFIRMQLTREQQAMFYLGRMLNTVEYIQKEKKKTVIEKVNFNGMDKDDIQRLRIALLEKAKQYGRINKLILTDRKFGELFDFNNWQLNPNESVFFLLTGYSFGSGTPGAKESETTEQG